MLLNLIQEYGGNAGFETAVSEDDDFNSNHSVVSTNFSGTGFVIWSKIYLSRLKELYKSKSLLVEDFIRFIIRHEKGHDTGPHGYEAQAELAAVSEYENPLEGVITGLSMRLHYAQKFLKDGETLYSRKGHMPNVLDKYCPWLREDLRREVIDKSLELVEG